MSALALSAAAAAATAPICADRPSKANGVCTVPVRHWQVELSAVDWTHTSDGSEHTDMTTVGSIFVKLGLTGSADVEIGFSPLIHVRTDRAIASGIGDVVLRYKQRLSASDAKVQAAIVPFVKLPTAKLSIGNGRVESGVALPLSTAVGRKLSLTLGPEADVLADANGHGRHLAITNLVNLGWSASSRLGVSAELWSSQNFDPAGTLRQWSADASAAYLVSQRTQLDVGANFGLNRATPDLELYGGVSILF